MELININNRAGAVPLEISSLNHPKKNKAAIEHNPENKPDIILKLENICGAGKTLRQGNIYAHPLPYAWGEMVQEWKMRKFLRWISKPRSVRIFRAEHLLTGRIHFGKFNAFWLGKPISEPHCGFEGLVLAEGILERQGYKTLQLKGPHILCQKSRFASI